MTSHRSQMGLDFGSEVYIASAVFESKNFKTEVLQVRKNQNGVDGPGLQASLEQNHLKPVALLGNWNLLADTTIQNIPKVSNRTRRHSRPLKSLHNLVMCMLEGQMTEFNHGHGRGEEDGS